MGRFRTSQRVKGGCFFLKKEAEYVNAIAVGGHVAIPSSLDVGFCLGTCLESSRHLNRGAQSIGLEPMRACACWA